MILNKNELMVTYCGFPALVTPILHSCAGTHITIKSVQKGGKKVHVTKHEKINYVLKVLGL